MKVILKWVVKRGMMIMKKEVKCFYKKVICGLLDLVCLRIVDKRQVESV